MGKRQAAIDHHRKVKVLIRLGEGFVPSNAKGSPETDTQLARLSSVSEVGVTISELCNDLLSHIAACPDAYRD